MADEPEPYIIVVKAYTPNGSDAYDLAVAITSLVSVLPMQVEVQLRVPPDKPEDTKPDGRDRNGVIEIAIIVSDADPGL